MAQRVFEGYSCVSIHASAREATFTVYHRIGSMWVSIHASAREATLSQMVNRDEAGSFNPRLRTGGDHMDGARCPLVWSFNPRLRTGGDSRVPLPYGRHSCFNPRLRTGGDTW